MKLIVRLLKILDYVHEIDDFKILARFAEGHGVTVVARGMGISVQSAYGHIERLMKLGYCEYNDERQVVLSDKGRRWVAEIETEFAMVMRGFLSDDRFQWGLARDTIERRLELRRLLLKLGKGEDLTIVEAIKLEDAGLGVRVRGESGPQVELTDKGELLLSVGKPGPRPGNGNRHARIVTAGKS